MTKLLSFPVRIVLALRDLVRPPPQKRVDATEAAPDGRPPLDAVKNAEGD